MAEKKKKIRILFIAAHRRDRSPSQRFRYEQYVEFLTENGFSCDFSPLISANDDPIFYRKGKYFSKFLILFKSYCKRLWDLLRARKYDIIFIQREAFMTGSIFFEKMFRKVNAKVVFDFDDAIWLQNVSEANKKLGWLKDAEKTSKIIALSDMVFAGNAFLARYASKYNDNIKIVPTTIDTEEYKKIPQEDHESICIGWSGSFSTIVHFELALPVLTRIKKMYGSRVSFKVIGSKEYINEALGIVGLGWSKEDEIKELSGLDIGIMPLPDDEWAQGKCGLKGLQYMALEIPTVMSPVGVNVDIIQDGVNGFLAKDEDEWVQKLSQLIESPSLRSQMGGQGRKTVLEKYSVSSEKHNYLKYFKELLNLQTK